jgi:hypothetical protein
MQASQQVVDRVRVACAGWDRVHPAMMHPPLNLQQSLTCFTPPATLNCRTLPRFPTPPAQVPATVDNIRESVVACAGAALGLPPDALLPTHRLDVGTSGVVVLARATPAAHTFQQLLQDKADKVVKVRLSVDVGAVSGERSSHSSQGRCMCQAAPAQMGYTAVDPLRLLLLLLVVVVVPLLILQLSHWLTLLPCCPPWCMYCPQVYRCLTAAPPPLGPAVHWALVGCRAPGEPAHTRVVTGPEVPRAVRCELRVLQVSGWGTHHSRLVNCIVYVCVCCVVICSMSWLHKLPHFLRFRCFQLASLL